MSSPGSKKIAFLLFCVGHWNVSLYYKRKGIFMMQPRFQASVIAWPVLHNLKATSKGVFFSCIDYLLLVVAKRSFKLKPRFHAIIVT